MVYFLGAQGLPGAQGFPESAFFFFFFAGPQGFSGPQGLDAVALAGAASAASAEAAGASMAVATSKADRVWATCVAWDERFFKETSRLQNSGDKERQPTAHGLR
jgi:hypothetical protein